MTNPPERRYKDADDLAYSRELEARDPGHTADALGLSCAVAVLLVVVALAVTYLVARLGVLITGGR